MTNRYTLIAALGMGLGMLSAPVFASSHREAPAISKDPAADNTDLYAWVNKGTHDKLQVVMNFNPLEEPSGGPNFHEFSDDVLYALHIAQGSSTGFNSLNDYVTYYFTFSHTPITRQDPKDLNAPLVGGKEFFAQITGQKQLMTVTKVQNGRATTIAQNVVVVPPNIGKRTFANAWKPIYTPNTTETDYTDAWAESFIATTTDGSGGRVWAGPRDDGFYVDLGGIFDLAGLRIPQVAGGTAQDGVAGYNVHSIAIEIPTTTLTANGQLPVAGDAGMIGVWSSAYRRQISIRFRGGENFQFGPWVQVSRLGVPLINEAVIGIQDKDYWNSLTPAQDVYFKPYYENPVVVRDAKAVGIYGMLGVADVTPFQSGRTDIFQILSLQGNHKVNVFGDMLFIDMGTDSAFPNGRSIPGGAMANQEQNDVTDTILTVILSKTMIAIKDNVNHNDVNFRPNFPWLALPWRGFDQGHGKAAP